MFSAKRTNLTSRRLGTVPQSFLGGNLSSGSIYDAAYTIENYNGENTLPQVGGSFTVNGVNIGNYDFCVKPSATTVSSFASSDWFTNNQDTSAAYIICKGNLTISNGILFRPSVRKMMTVLFVRGNLIINGIVSMSRRGAYWATSPPSFLSLHSTLFPGIYTQDGLDTESLTWGSSTSYPWSGAYLSNSASGNGGSAIIIPSGNSSSSYIGTSGSNATLSTHYYPGPLFGASLFIGCGGGGGSGSAYMYNIPGSSYPSITKGAGGNGFIFGGGSGGGSLYGRDGSWVSGQGQAGADNGGIGGNKSGNGNPPHSGLGSGEFAGTGGLLIIIATGSITGTGYIESNGGDTTGYSTPIVPDSYIIGGATGGGTILTYSQSYPTVGAQVNGGKSSFVGFGGNPGGNGGNGSLIRFKI